jgi:hypothetical protein
MHARTCGRKEGRKVGRKEEKEGRKEYMRSRSQWEKVRVEWEVNQLLLTRNFAVE